MKAGPPAQLSASEIAQVSELVNSPSIPAVYSCASRRCASSRPGSANVAPPRGTHVIVRLRRSMGTIVKLFRLARLNDLAQMRMGGVKCRAARIRFPGCPEPELETTHERINPWQRSRRHPTQKPLNSQPHLPPRFLRVRAPLRRINTP